MVDRVTVLLRMPPELGRDSVNAWILDAVREHLDDKDRLKVSLLRKSVQAAVGKENVATRLREQLWQRMDTNTRRETKSKCSELLETF